MRDMKQGWEIKKLGEVCKFFRGLTYSKGDEVETSNKMVLRSNNVDLETNTLVFDDMKCLREDFDIDEDKKVKPGSILICMSNGSKQHIGKVAFIKEAIDYAFGGFMGLIYPYKDYSAKYVYYACTSSAFKHFLAGIGNGIGITNLRFSDLSEFTIPVPPLPEQEKIVSELDCLSGIIEKKRQQLKELDALAQSIFYEMFGDPVTNEKGWEVKKIGDVCNFSQGVQIDVPLQSTEKKEGWNRFLRIVDYTTCNTDMRYVKVSNEKYFVKQDDVVVVRYGASAGFVGIDKEGVLANNLFKLNHDRKILSYKYLYYLLSTDYYKSFIKDVAFGAAMPALSFSSFKMFRIFLPPLPLQQTFAAKIEAIEKQKELIKQSLGEVETLFNSRMDYYFN